MGIGITQEHRDLADSVRRWLARAVPPEAVRKLLDGTEEGRRPACWDSAAAQGLHGIHLPEEYGGGGGTLLDLAVVLEGAGRAALPGPYLPSVLASEVLRRGGQGRFVAALAAGERIGAVALGAGTLIATPVDGGYRLDGAALPVLGGAQADVFVLAAGGAWFAVDAGELVARTHESADPPRPTAEVTAHGVVVPADRLLSLDDAGDTIRDLAAVLYAAEACGTAGWALHTAVEHAKVREQFGRPIGQFQAVKHLCADMLVRLEQARALTWDAARAVDTEAGALVAALAAATALDAAYSCAKDCIQILGGIGFTWEHDAHLYLRRALVARQLLGPGDAHRLRAARLAAAGARRELRLELPTEAGAYREQAREAIAGARGLDPGAACRALAATGYAAPAPAAAVRTGGGARTATRRTA